MKTGKITAKLRDAVPVCLIVEGKEVKRYKNIELPDAIKEIEMRDFHFYIPQDGKITFQIHYEKGALPDVFPAPRAKMTRAEESNRQGCGTDQNGTGRNSAKGAGSPRRSTRAERNHRISSNQAAGYGDLIAAPHTETAAEEIPEENMQEAVAASQQEISKDSYR